MNRIFSRLGFTTLALVAGSSVVGFAQDSTTGAISGTVTGQNGALIAGARVILDGGRGQIVRVTDASGAFKASGLIPGQYAITVVAPGYEAATKLTAIASINTLTPVRVSVSKAAGTVVEVVATSQAVDTTTQTSGTTFTSEVVSSLPLGRSFSSVVNLAPGVSASGVDANNPSVSGSSGLENAYVIDGVNTTGTGYGASGAYSITWGSRGTGINTDFISEVQIKSFGMDAEFGGTTGGLVNAVTKTGDNTFRGQAFAYLDIDSLQARQKTSPIIDPNQLTPNRSDGFTRQEFGFTVSGPIIKDKLFYFVGYNPIRNEQKVTQVDNHPGSLNYGTQFTRKQQTDTYYGKLNWAMTANQSLEFSIFGDPGKDPYQPLSGAMTRTTSDKWSSLEYGSSNWSLKYNGVFFNDMLVEARVSQSKNKFHQGLSGTVNNAFRVLDVYTAAAINGHGGPGFYENKDEKNRQYDFKVTKTFGDFEFKAGYASEKLEYASGTYYQGPPGQVDTHTLANGGSYSSGALVNQRYYMLNPNLVDANGHTTLANIVPFYRVTRARFSTPAIAVESPWEAYFVQAKYSWNNRLFIKAGFRWEGEEMQGRNETYKFKPADAMAPRLSITWDPEGNGKNKIYAFYGKYFEKVPLDLNVRSLSQEIGTSRSDWYNLNDAGSILSNPIQTGVNIREANPYTLVAGPAAGVTSHYTGSAGFLTPVLPGTKLPYTNEYVLGWDTQINDKVRVSNRIIHRTLGRVLEDMGIDGGNNLPYYIANPGENSSLIAAQAKLIDPTLGNSVLVNGQAQATWPKPQRDYWAWEVEANFNSSHWAGFFNLRLSRLEGNYEGLFRNDNGQSDPNITSLYDFSSEYMKKYEDPTNTDYHPRGLTGNEAFASGPLPNDRAVIVNAGLGYNWESGFATGFLVKIQTGTPLNKFYGLIDYDNAGELAAGGRGSEGRTPSTMAVDWTGSYTMKFHRTQSLTLRADVFNLFNASKPQNYDQNYEASVDAINANYGNTISTIATNAYQNARRVRIGVKYQF